jgi:colanic acid biosynthesis glycosyl transferase WcaI
MAEPVEHGRANAANRLASARVLMVSINYWPEHAGIGPYATEVAEHLAALGAQVHVLAGLPHYPQWRVEPRYRRPGRHRELLNNVNLVRLWHYVPRRQGGLRRAAYEASFLAHAAITDRGWKPDVVLAMTPSLGGALAAARAARRHRAPFVVIVQDLMGAAAEQSGIAGGDRVAAAASGIERRVLSQAAAVGIVHDMFRPRVVALGASPERVHVVPNWSRIATPTVPAAEMRAKLGWPEDELVLLHAGNMGFKQGLEVVVDAGRLAQEGGHQLRVVLMGDGNQRAALQARGASVGTVEFRDPVDEDQFPNVLGAADVLLLTQRGTVQDMSMPSKLTSYLLAGRPVLSSVALDSPTAGEVRRSGAGVLVPPDDPAELLAAALRLGDDPACRAELGRRGPEFATEHLGRAAGLARVDAMLSRVLSDQPT